MKLSIAFVTSGLPFDGRTLEKQALGGSETALAYLSRALAKRGHEVHVFCTCSKEGEYDGVHYFHAESFQRMNLSLHHDVVVVSRFLQFLTMHSFAGLRVLWCHDTLTDRNLVMSSLWQTDMLILLSDFHKRNYLDSLPELKDLVWKSSNAVDLDLIQRCRVSKVPGKLIFTSRPERGLHFLLGDIFPRLLEQRPDLKLGYCNYSISQLSVPEQVRGHENMCNHMAADFGDKVVNLGNLPKAELYQHISSSQLLLYPTDFPEISCITAMEAQACGTPIVTTDDFALKETVGPDSGLLISGKPPDEKYVEQYVGRVLDLLSNEDRLTKMSAAGPAWVEETGYTWDKVAAAWEQKLLTTLEGRWKSYSGKVVQELERHSDLAMAELIANQVGDKAKAQRIGAYARNLEKRELLPIVESAAGYEKTIPTYQKVCRLVAMAGIPKRILDFRCGDPAFGLVAKRAFPDAFVLCVDPDEEALRRVNSFAVQSKQELACMTEEEFKTSEQGLFDLIFVNDYVDTLLAPLLFLEKMRQRLTDNGILMFTARVGPTSVCYKDSDHHSRVWNFTFADFKEMFVDVQHFSSTFIETDISPAGELLGRWHVILTKHGEMRMPTPDVRRLTTRPYQAVSACMIVKDEEANLKRCVDSFRHVVDELIIVDTGSKDGTVQIAQDLATEVRKVDFDNFSQVRNESLRAAKGDWIFWIDADEVVAGVRGLRKYLRTAVYEGYVIRQHHLMLDVEKSFDTPIRVFRNWPHYKFTGLIHEHCEDTSKGPFDNPIFPTLILPDVDIAHYGYLNERVRRAKCSNRNMELLRRDTLESVGRKLTWVLVIRDYLNMSRWDLEKTQGKIELGSKNHERLKAAVSCFLEKFPDPETVHAKLAFPMYQQALAMLGSQGLPVEGKKTPPFEVALSLSGCVGGLQNRNLKPSTIWFIDDEQFINFLRKKGAELIVGMCLAGKEKYEVELKTIPTQMPYDSAAGAQLLAEGVNVAREG